MFQKVVRAIGAGVIGLASIQTVQAGQTQAAAAGGPLSGRPPLEEALKTPEGQKNPERTFLSYELDANRLALYDKGSKSLRKLIYEQALLGKFRREISLASKGSAEQRFASDQMAGQGGQGDRTAGELDLVKRLGTEADVKQYETLSARDPKRATQFALEVATKKWLGKPVEPRR